MTDKIADTHAELAIDQDRLEITDLDAEADTYVKAARREQPLSASETHAELITHTENGYVSIQLGAPQLDSLQDALENVQEHYE